jgi:SWI/SNF-related matrix-associated actin-dependent regulator 1 of chromatin subfamily A
MLAPALDELPVPTGLKLMPFQADGVRFMLERQNTLLGDEMGLGKTPQSIVFLNSVYWERALIVVPAFLRLNWFNELKRWLTKDADIFIVWDGKTLPPETSSRTLFEGGGRPQIIITSYDLLSQRIPQKGADGKATDKKHWPLAPAAALMAKTKYDVQICDEAHYLKNRKAFRTRATLAIKSQRFIAATGTPILNRPVEVWNLAHRCDPTTFNDYWHFVKRYCDAHDGGFGYDVSGASNLGELQQRLKISILIRRLKKDVLTDLPAKTRQIIEMPPTAQMRTTLNRENMQWEVHEETLAALVERRDRAAILEDEEEYREAARLLKAAYTVAFEEMSRVRKETALAKLPLCINHIEDVLEQVDKLIVFAHHKDVIRQLADALKQYGCMMFFGDTPQMERAANVKRFQEDPRCRVAIVGISAAVGITLTAASHEVFVESDWVPANLSQAEDRAHRIGQKNCVLVQHLVLEGSLDSKMLKTVISKQEVIDDALDVKPGSEQQHKAVQRRKINYADIGSKLDVHQRGAILLALQKLTAMDGDKAQAKNGKGFSKFDSNIGHELAKMQELTAGRAGFGQHLVRRYRAQLDDALVRACGITDI